MSGYKLKIPALALKGALGGGRFVSQAFANDVAEAMAHAARQVWMELAGSQLHNSREIYLNAIGNVEQIGPGEFHIQMGGPNVNLAAMFEEGNQTPFHMSNLPPVVAFHTRLTGSATGSWLHKSQSISYPLQSRFGALAPAIGHLISKEVRRNGLKAPGFSSIYGQPRHPTAQGHSAPLFANAKSVSSGSFVTFRSFDPSDASKWIYPVTSGAQLIPKVESIIESMQDSIIRTVAAKYKG